MDALIEDCRALARTRPGLAAISRILRVGPVDPGELGDLCRRDPARPYGRRVLIDTPDLEGMVATWTPSFPCAPHDHGGSVGGVRVLRGVALHRIWRVAGGRLELVREERCVAGDVLICGPDLVHSMRDAGEGPSLMTLHLYAAPIDHMVVYDLATERTAVVDGGCGAWLPLDRPDLIRELHEGFVVPASRRALAPLPRAAQGAVA